MNYRGQEFAEGEPLVMIVEDQSGERKSFVVGFEEVTSVYAISLVSPRKEGSRDYARHWFIDVEGKDLSDPKTPLMVSGLKMLELRRANGEEVEDLKTRGLEIYTYSKSNDSQVVGVR